MRKYVLRGELAPGLHPVWATDADADQFIRAAEPKFRHPSEVTLVRYIGFGALFEGNAAGRF